MIVLGGTKPHNGWRSLGGKAKMGYLAGVEIAYFTHEMNCGYLHNTF
jgi:hypothetical protein